MKRVEPDPTPLEGRRRVRKGKRPPTAPVPVRKRRKRVPPLPVVGWREWVVLPDLGIDRIKAKIDTGARTSALHALNIEPLRHAGTDYVAFHVHPEQRVHGQPVECVARMVDRRYITDSGGKRRYRYVVETRLRLGGREWPIELTLVDRQTMGFRLLLGRTAIKGRFLVHPGKSYRQGKHPEAEFDVTL